LPKVAISDKKIIEELNATDKKIVVIDGCPLNCAQKIMENNGLTKFVHVNVTDFGITKGKTPLTTDKLSEMTDFIISLENKS